MVASVVPRESPDENPETVEYNNLRKHFEHSSKHSNRQRRDSIDRDEIKDRAERRRRNSSIPDLHLNERVLTVAKDVVDGTDELGCRALCVA